LAGGDGEDDEEDEEDDDVQPGGSNPFAALADLKGAVNAAEFVPHRCVASPQLLSCPQLLSAYLVIVCMRYCQRLFGEFLCL